MPHALDGSFQVGYLRRLCPRSAWVLKVIIHLKWGLCSWRGQDGELVMVSPGQGEQGCTESTAENMKLNPTLAQSSACCLPVLGRAAGCKHLPKLPRRRRKEATQGTKGTPGEQQHLSRGMGSSRQWDHSGWLRTRAQTFRCFPMVQQWERRSFLSSCRDHSRPQKHKDSHVPLTGSTLPVTAIAKETDWPY